MKTRLQLRFALTRDNADYIKRVARAKQKSLSAVINELIELVRKTSQLPNKK